MANRSNHPRKYACDEDLKELKTRFYRFVDNDFRHLQIKVSRQEGMLYALLGLIGVVVAKVLGAF